MHKAHFCACFYAKTDNHFWETGIAPAGASRWRMLTSEITVSVGGSGFTLM
jgi:hypothetical protein